MLASRAGCPAISSALDAEAGPRALGRQIRWLGTFLFTDVARIMRANRRIARNCAANTFPTMLPGKQRRSLCLATGGGRRRLFGAAR